VKVAKTIVHDIAFIIIAYIVFQVVMALAIVPSLLWAQWTK
jgi:hypothetical protein